MSRYNNLTEMKHFIWNSAFRNKLTADGSTVEDGMR